MVIRWKLLFDGRRDDTLGSGRKKFSKEGFSDGGNE